LPAKLKMAPPLWLNSIQYQWSKLAYHWNALCGTIHCLCKPSQPSRFGLSFLGST
jgi:hypothetical protein